MCVCGGGYVCVCVGVGTVHGHAVESYLSEQEETKGMKDVQIAEVIG